MRKLIVILILITMAFSMLFVGCSNIEKPTEIPETPDDTPKEDTVTMTNVEKEYYGYLEHPETFPVSFVYKDCYYHGFDPKYCEVVSVNESSKDGGTERTTVFNMDDLTITLVSAVYPKYSAFDYTVHFSNNGNAQSGIIRQLNATDISYDCDGAILKGIMGDYDYQYAPYEKDLSKESVSFRSDRGRATHTYFPYFNLEAKNNGAIIAIGWAGTWSADFAYDTLNKKASFRGEGTNDLCTYLNPGESIRTPLMAFVRYYDADEDTAMNMWRKWYIDCNMPYEDGTKTQKVQPHEYLFTSLDVGAGEVIASIPETAESARIAMDAYYNLGLKADYRWLDAGWYSSPSGADIGNAWWDTVGAWTVDKRKWPDNSLAELATYSKETYGAKTIIWFEPERVTYINELVNRHGYNASWALGGDTNGNLYINNLGNKDCLEWTYNKIVTVMDDNNMDAYREDFNCDPAVCWRVTDGLQGPDRSGITENLYLQGHYELWDRLLDHFAETGRPTFIDSCASGGGRNDLETMRRAVPLMRSDAEGAGIALRLAMTTTFTKWIPYTGCFAKESNSQGGIGVTDLYSMRATMFPAILYAAKYSHSVKQNQIEDQIQYQQERVEYSKYFWSDFYVLTPYRGVTNDNEWTAYMYYDADMKSGVISAFRQAQSKDANYSISVKGIDPNKYYSVRDIDGVNSFAKVKGSALIDGLVLYAAEPRTALILYITELE